MPIEGFLWSWLSHLLQPYQGSSSPSLQPCMPLSLTGVIPESTPSKPACKFSSQSLLSGNLTYVRWDQVAEFKNGILELYYCIDLAINEACH